jgi:hypothetical protein
MHDSLAVGEGALCKLVFRLEQRLLCLQQGQKIGRALAILQACDTKSFPRRFHLAREIIHRATCVSHLHQRFMPSWH